MFESTERQGSSGHQPTSEVGSEELDGDNANTIASEPRRSVSRKEENDMEIFMRVLRGMSSGWQSQSTPTLVKFDPEDPEADIEGWCKVNDVIIKHKELKGTDLLLSLTHALRGRAASCLTKINADCITWENIKDLLIAKFSKPMLMQDYFDRVIKFQVNYKETAADAAMRLWQLIETIPKVNLPEEVITGFVMCFACGRPGHVSAACASAREASAVRRREVKLCGRGAVTGELDVAGMSCHFLFDAGSECSLIKEGFACRVQGTVYYEPVILVGVGNADVGCSGQLLCVVDDGVLIEPVLLGRDLIEKGVHVEMDSSGVSLFRSRFGRFCQGVMPPEIKLDTDLIGEQKESLLELLSKYSDCFVEGVPTRRVAAGVVKVDLIDEGGAVRRRPYRLSASERAIVNGGVSELLAAGVMREGGSPFAGPILLVRGKDGSDGVVVDCRELNSSARSDSCPLPRMGDRIDGLHGANCFASLDVISGFRCVPIGDGSMERAAFVAPDGQYEYVAMPFGLGSAPSVFQRGVRGALKHCDFAQVCIDDVLVPSKSVEEGLERLDLVLEALAESGFSLNMKKCSFLKAEVTYLGCVIGAGEVGPNPNKMEALAGIPAPRNAAQVRQFVGLASYFGQFVPNFSTVMAPLYPLVQHKGEIKWTDVHDSVHKQIISILTSEPVLAIFDPDKETELHTDASSVGCGAVLIQRRSKVPHVVECFGRRTTEAESRCRSCELETLAVVRAVEHFRHCLCGRRFTVRTDCNALESSSTKRDLAPRVHGWWAVMQGCDFQIECRGGRLVSHADYLSRGPLPEPGSSSRPGGSSVETGDVRVLDLQRGWLAVEQQRDGDVVDIVAKWTSGGLSPDIAQSYDVGRGLLYRKVQRNKRGLWLPVVPLSLAWSLIGHVHGEIEHLGFGRTLDELYDCYWFPGMAGIVERFVDACIVCETCRGASGAQRMGLRSVPGVTAPWHTLHIDVGGKLSGRSRRGEYVFVIIDAFARCILLRHTFGLDADGAVEALKRAVQLFGAPKRVVADRGRCSVGSGFERFCAEHSIDLHVIAAGAGGADGRVEGVMQALKNCLTIIENNSNSVWRDELGEMQLVLSATGCGVAGFSPTELVFGVKAQSLGISQVSHNDDDVVGCGDSLSEIGRLASENIERVSGGDAVRFSEAGARVEPFHEGDFVFLKCCERNQTKLDKKFKGPFKITKVLGNDRYELRNIDGSNRVYKYAHESLREVPKGRAGLTEVAQAMCDDTDGAVGESENVESVVDQNVTAVNVEAESSDSDGRVDHIITVDVHDVQRLEDADMVVPRD